MRPRIFFGRLLIRFGHLIQSLSIAVMRPKDLAEFGRQAYSQSHNLNYWSSQKLLESGLSSTEKSLLDRIPFQNGKALVLGCGGGREAVLFAQMGFSITAVDFVSEMVALTVKNARIKGLEIAGLVQELSSLNLPSSAFELAWLSQAMYSSIPTKKKRIVMVRRIRDSLRPGGYLVCQFHCERGRNFSTISELAKRLFSYLTLGNLWYEKGDILWGNREFLHVFLSEREVRSELEEAGFELIFMHLPEGEVRGGAVLRKPV